MKTKNILTCLLAAIFIGCVPVMSLHPLYNDENLVVEKSLTGTWAQDSNSVWQFSLSDKFKKSYELIYTDKENKKGFFVASLVKLDSKLFLDVWPADFPSGEEKDPNKVIWPYNICFLWPMHTFVKVNSIEPQLKLQLTDNEEMKRFFKEDPNAVRHEVFSDDGLVLTATTKELQAFVLKYAQDNRVFTKEIVLSRKTTSEPNDPNSIQKKN
jgi:hypothetical protein